jgi:hypothetical protein
VVLITFANNHESLVVNLGSHNSHACIPNLNSYLIVNAPCEIATLTFGGHLAFKCTQFLTKCSKLLQICTILKIVCNQCWLTPPPSHVYNVDVYNPPSYWIYDNAKPRFFYIVLFILSKSSIGPIWPTITTLMGLYSKANTHRVICIGNFNFSKAS